MNWIGIIATMIATMTVFVSLFSPVAGKTDKLAELQALQGSANIIEFTKTQFKKYVLKEPRDYDIMVYYTLSQRCDHCVNMEQELNEVAYSYNQAGKSQADGDKRALFFAKIEFNQLNEELFRLSDFSSVPILALSTPELAKRYANKGDAIYDSGLEWKINSQDFFDAGKILEHVNKITNNEVELKYTLMRVMMGNILIFGLLAILFFFKDYLGSLLQQRLVWMVGTVIIFVMCIGGTAFNMIHKVPTFKYGHDQSGNLVVEEYFQRNQRSQYSGEGYMVSMLMFTIGSVMVAFTYVGHAKGEMKKNIIGVGLVLLIFVLITILNIVFTLKAQHYDPSFFPPEHYQAGPLMFDQGTIITNVGR